MNYKLTILNAYFFLVLIGTILIKFGQLNFFNISGTYLFAFFSSIPLFILQFVSIARFSNKVKRGNPKLFKEACRRPNGTQGSSINVASLFDENIPFEKLKNKTLLQELDYTKRVVVFSMISFLVLIILFFI